MLAHMKGWRRWGHQGMPLEFLCKHIDIQEQDDARLGKPLRVADRVEQRERLLKMVLDV
jgi:hypothetical protein